MLTVVGVDSSLTSTGLCVLADGQPALSRSRTKPGRPGTTSTLARMRHQRDAVLAASDGADLVLIEGLSFGSKGSATRDLAGLWWLAVDALLERGHPLGVAAPGVLKKWTTGTGNADKFAVFAAIGRRWPHVPLGGPDEADALALASLGLHHLGELPWTPTAYQTEQVSRVEWLAATVEDRHAV